MKPRKPETVSILDVLPTKLRREASPERCVCRGCAPSLTDAQRAAEERAQRRWRESRAAWCRANDYAVMDLLLAERFRPAPSKKRAATVRTDTPERNRA